MIYVVSLIVAIIVWICLNAFSKTRYGKGIGKGFWTVVGYYWDLALDVWDGRTSNHPIHFVGFGVVVSPAVFGVCWVLYASILWCLNQLF